MILLWMLFAYQAQAANLSAKLFEKGHDQVLFYFKHTDEGVKEGLETGLTVYSDSTGRQAVIEKLQFKDEKMVHYELEQKQLHQQGSIEIKDGTATLKFTGYKDKTLSWTEDTINGPTMVRWLRSKWPQILKGETLKAQFVVLDRMDSYTFNYSKMKEDASEVVVIMKPSSGFLRMLVDPIYIHFKPDGQKVTKIEGRALPKKPSNGKYVDLNAEMIYE